MALKIDGVTSFFTKLTNAFNASTIIKNGGSVIISAAQSYFDSFRTSVTDGANASNGLKEGGRIGNIYTRIKDIAASEGVYGTSHIAVATTTLNQVSSGEIRVVMGKIGLLKSLSLINNGGGCTATVTMRKSSIPGDHDPEVLTMTRTLIDGKDAIVNIPIDTVIFENGYINLTVTQTSATACNVSLVAAIEYITSSLELNARYTYLSISNSIGWSRLGNEVTTNILFKGDSYYNARLKNQLRNDGIDIRYINHGFGGSTSTAILEQVLSHRYDFIKFDFCTIQASTNDAGLALDINTFRANYMAILKYLYRLNPDAQFILLGDPVTDVAARSTLPNYRAVLSDIANNNKPYPAMKLSYFDLSTTFALNATATADLNFTNAERVLGSRLHPGGYGHALMKTGLYNYIKTLPFYSQFKKDLTVINEIT